MITSVTYFAYIDSYNNTCNYHKHGVNPKKNATRTMIMGPISSTEPKPTLDSSNMDPPATNAASKKYASILKYATQFQYKIK